MLAAKTIGGDIYHAVDSLGETMAWTRADALSRKTGDALASADVGRDAQTPLEFSRQVNGVLQQTIAKALIKKSLKFRLGNRQAGTVAEVVTNHAMLS